MSRWAKRFARLRDNPGDAVLLARVVALSALVHPLVHRIGVSRTARLVRPRVRDVPWTGQDWLQLRRVQVIVDLASPKTSPWVEGACLERALLLYRLLNLEGVPVDLVVGLRSVDGKVDGHAWVAQDGQPVLEGFDPLVEFRPALCFPSPFKGTGLPFPQMLSESA